MGIWFKDDPRKRPVWVANRYYPLINSTCFLQIRDDGNLILIDRRLVPVIVNPGALSTSPNTTATLLDTGNFVLQVGAKVVWQSFDYPMDTYLPGMKIGWFGLTSDLPTIQVLSSWASPSNPTHGDFTLGVDYMVANLSVYRGDSAHVNIGYWDGTRIHLLFANSLNGFNFSYFSNPNESYFTFTTIGNYSMSWLVMASTGLIDEYTLSDRGISMMSHSLCEDLGNYIVNGSFCLPSTPSTCNATFSAINGSMSNSSIANGSIFVGFSNCESICASNCSCVAYTAPATDQSGCQMYFGNEDDLSNIIQKGGGLVYVRGDSILPRKHKAGSKRMLWAILGGSLVTIFLVAASLWCYNIRRKSTVNQVRSQDDANTSAVQVFILQMGTNATSINNETAAAARLELNGERDQELPMLSFSTIETATDYFAIRNILGEGGFGTVYKDGLYSEKLDVFSFGIVVLEILSGKRNIAFFETSHTSNLVGYAWNSWKEGKHTEFMDSALTISCSSIEALRYLQLGLLCVQERPADRLSMPEVVSMLSNETTALPYPKEAALLGYVSSSTEGESSKNNQGPWVTSVESVVSVISPR
ncbi:hypothetical protein RHSIM_Rhsim02G0195100 [Rhododendron simsii]|uniref:Uncharacterized protein n=1 Tax=Rhododendron simsii TaxID=118357 RepID=A0A834LXU4_RHOSS|nr:hypothetical protein RHSIM_Rhsim02G0195100 [Rhododendron simsii]